MTLVAQDSFERSVAAGANWGTADLGGAWSRQGSTSPEYSVAGGVGIHQLITPGSQGGQLLAGISEADIEILVLNTWDETALGANLFPAGLLARYIDVDNFYSHQLRIDLATPDQLETDIRSHVGGTSTGISGGNVVVTATMEVGSGYWTRFRVQGDELKVKVWEDGDIEPSAWLAEVTNSDHSAPGAIGTRYSTGGGSSNLPTITYDEFEANSLDSVIQQQQRIRSRRSR